MVVGRNDARDDRKRGTGVAVWDHLQGSVSANAINSSVGARSRRQLRASRTCMKPFETLIVRCLAASAPQRRFRPPVLRVLLPSETNGTLSRPRDDGAISLPRGRRAYSG